MAALIPRLAAEGLQVVLAEVEALRSQAGLPAQRVALALACAEAAVGDYRAEVVRPAAAQALAEAVPDSQDDLRARLLLAAGEALQGQAGAAVQALDALRPRIDAVADPLLAAMLWGHCALVEHAAGRMSPCVQALEQQQRLAQQAGAVAVEVQARSSLGALHMATGDTERGIDQAREAGRLHRRMGEAHAALLADANLAIGLIGCDRLGAALDLLQSMAGPLQGAGDLERIASELQVEVWLRLGQPGPALRLLAAAPPDDAPLARQLNWHLLHAQAVQLSGDGAAAADLWRALRRRLPPASSPGVRLRADALSSVVLPAAQARALLTQGMVVADRAGMPAGAGLARLRRAAFAWRDGDLPAAVQDVRWLLAGRARLQHLYVSTAELLALAWAVLDAAGQADEAAAVQAEARRWLAETLRPGLPAGSEACWRAHPAHRGLFGPVPGDGDSVRGGLPVGPRLSG